MADPVLRIPIDDAAFKRYMEAFERYQSQLEEQPEKWADANEKVLEGVAANMALADAIGQSVAAAVRLGDTQERNAQRRKREAENSDVEEQRASGWRRKALDHVQELNRSASTAVRSFGGFAAGGKGAGGMFGMIADAGKGLGGDIGAVVSLIGHTLNAGYEINNAVSDKGMFARGIGATIGQQEGFHNNLGRYTNTDQGIDAVMNARGSPDQWWQFNSLGVHGYRGDKSNAQVYGDVLRSQVDLAKRNTHNGVTDWFAADPRGASAFGTTHEDLNRLMKAPDLDKAIKEAIAFKTPLADKQIDAATKSVIAMDNLTTRLTDNTQALTVSLSPQIDKLTSGMDKLIDITGKLYDLLSFNWFGNKGKDSKPPSVAGQIANQALLGPIGGTVANMLGFDPIASVEHLFGFGSGGGKASKSSSKNDVRVYKDMAAYLKRTGLSDAASMGAAAGAIAESHGNPNAYNKNSGAFGIGQWLGARKKGLLAMAARDKVDPHNYYEQLKYLAWELHGGDAGGKAVMGAGSVDAALKAYVYKFMRPQGKHNEHLADAIADVNRGSNVANAANVTVKVQVSAPPGHQTAVSTNSAAKG